MGKKKPFSLVLSPNDLDTVICANCILVRNRNLSDVFSSFAERIKFSWKSGQMLAHNWYVFLYKMYYFYVVCKDGRGHVSFSNILFDQNDFGNHKAVVTVFNLIHF